MTDLLRQGAQWLEQMRREHCSSPVNYEHDGSIYAVNATVGKTDYDVATDSGLSIGAHVVDFIITAADLPFEPEVGDRIELDGLWHEVMALGDDIRGWRWSDPYRATYRIHTRHVNQ